MKSSLVKNIVGTNCVCLKLAWISLVLEQYESSFNNESFRYKFVIFTFLKKAKDSIARAKRQLISSNTEE
jgi:hypothetical protein